MDITFKQIDEKHIDIINDNKLIGHIFTPSGTMEEETNAIQICGFDYLFDYWGCGVFGDGKGGAKKDVQIWFNKNSQKDDVVGDIISGDSCGRCFYPKEKCKCNHDFKLERHDDIVKKEILNALDGR